MAHYLIDTGGDPNRVLRVEADSITKAIESLNLADGESVTVYRIIAEPRSVRVESKTIRHIVVE